MLCVLWSFLVCILECRLLCCYLILQAPQWPQLSVCVCVHVCAHQSEKRETNLEKERKEEGREIKERKIY